MNQYTLDFSDPVRPYRRTRMTRPAQRRMSQTFRRIVLLISGLVCSIVLVMLLRQRAQTRLVLAQYQSRTIQYDSLLAAKLETDRQLTQLRRQLLRQQPLSTNNFSTN